MADWRALMNDSSAWSSLTYDDPRLDAYAEEVEDKLNIPPGLLVAIKNAGERTPNTDGRWQSSHRGAQGIMQFIPSTMRLQNGKFQHNPQNPFESIAAAGLYLEHVLTQQYDGDVALAIIDYNGGYSQVQQHRRGERLVKETGNYLNRVADYLQNSTYAPRIGERLRARQQQREETRNGRRNRNADTGLPAPKS